MNTPTTYPSISADHGTVIRRLARRLFRVVVEPQSYRNIAYLLLGLPLGTIWFSVLVAWIAIGFSMLVVALLGVPILLATWYAVRAFGNVERAATNATLGTRLPIMPAGPHGHGNVWRRLRTLSADPVRRRELGFLMLRFPVGIATFTAAVTALSVPFAIAWSPVAARYDDSEPFGSWKYSARLDEICSSPWAWGLISVGAGLLIASFHLLNGLARVCARWTAHSLGAGN
jgi:hypothetical protein